MFRFHSTTSSRTYCVQAYKGRWACDCPARGDCWHKSASTALTRLGAAIECGTIDTYTGLLCAAMVTGNYQKVYKFRDRVAKARLAG